MRASLIVLLLAFLAVPAHALPPPCGGGQVFEDGNGNGVRDAGEPGLPGVKVSNGIAIAVTDARGDYTLDYVDGRTVFLIKPAGYDVAVRPDGLPARWRNLQYHAGPELKYGGIPQRQPDCTHFALRPRQAAVPARLNVLLFADSCLLFHSDINPRFFKKLPCEKRCAHFCAQGIQPPGIKNPVEGSGPGKSGN